MNPSINWKALEKNICDTLKEWELKLGYSKEPIELYYPAESLSSLLGLSGENADELEKVLVFFSDKVKEHLGEVQITRNRGRYCIRISEAGSRYVRDYISASPFLVKFLEVIHQPCSSLASVEQVFYEFSRHVVKKKEEDGAYIFFFQNAEIDEYVYCVEEEEFGLQYHRFTREDYKSLYGKLP